MTVLWAALLLGAPPVAPADAISDDTPPIALDALLSHAEAHAPALAVAAAEAGAAEAAMVEAAPWLPADPSVEIGAGARRAEGRTGLDLEVRVEQAVDVSGERGLRVEAAEGRRRAAQVRLAAARWRLAADVRGLVVELLIVGEEAERAGRQVAFAESLRTIAARRAEAGAAPASDLLLAEAERRHALEDAARVAQAADGLRVRLAALVGWPTPRVPPIAGALPALDAVPAVEALWPRLAEAHPALAAEAAEVAAARAAVAAEARAGWPDPTIGLSYARESAPGPEPAVDVWMAGVGLPIPLWRGNDAPRAQATAALRVAEARAAAAEASLRAELVAAVAAVERSAARARLHADEVLPELRAHTERVREAYARGAVDLLRVTRAHEALLHAEARALEARVAHARAVAALAGLMGDGIGGVQ